MKAPLFALLILVATAAASPITFTTRSGQKLVNAELTGTDGIDATFSDKSGTSSVPLEDLPADVQTRLHLDTSYARGALQRDEQRIAREKFAAAEVEKWMKAYNDALKKAQQAAAAKGKLRLMNTKYFVLPDEEADKKAAQ